MNKAAKFQLNDGYGTTIYINPTEVESINDSLRQKGYCFIYTKNKQTHEVCCTADEAYKRLFE